MIIGPSLYALMMLGNPTPAWYDPWSDPLRAYDRAACDAGTQTLQSCSDEPTQAEASQESYFEQPRDTRTSWWLQNRPQSTPPTDGLSPQ